MSVYYYLASPDLKEAVRIGQGGYPDEDGMLSFYYGIPLAMKQLQDLLNRGEQFKLINDLTDERELYSYRHVETDGEVFEPDAPAAPGQARGEGGGAGERFRKFQDTPGILLGVMSPEELDRRAEEIRDIDPTALDETSEGES